MSELLCLGQVDDAAAPAAAAGTLYIQGTGYGAPPGTPPARLVEAPDIAPAGPLGAALFRQLVVMVSYAAACRIRVTPILNLNTVLTARAVTIAFPAPSAPRTDPIVVKLARRGTYLRVRVEVLEAAGPVEIHTPQIGGEALTGLDPVATAP